MSKHAFVRLALVVSISAWAIAAGRQIVRLAPAPHPAPPLLGENALIVPLARSGIPNPVEISSAAVDRAGNIYLTGTRLVEPILIPSTPPIRSVASARSVYVAKFDPAGKPVYAISLGGKGNDYGLAIAADPQGNVVVAGYTTSPDFPLRHAVQETPFISSRGPTGFVFKLDSTGGLVWSTYFGGAEGAFTGSRVNAVAMDATGNAYVTGSTDAPSLPTTPGAFQTSGIATGFHMSDHAGGFVAKFSPSGTLLFSTYLGGTRPNCYGGSGCLSVNKFDSGTAIAVDASGNAHIAGVTNSVDFPRTVSAEEEDCLLPPPLAIRSSAGIPFIAKLNAGGTGVMYSRRVCGSVPEGSLAPVANAIALDAQGNAYLAGTARTSLFSVTPGVLQSTLKGASDAFVSKLDSAGKLIFSTFLGGSGADSATRVSVASDGAVVVTGATASSDFPDTAKAFPAGAAFVTRIDSQAARVLNSVRLPTGLTEAGIFAGAGTNVLAAGASGVVSRLLLDGVPETAALGAGNAATAGIQSALAGSSVVSIYGIGIGPEPAVVPVAGGRLQLSWAGVTVFFGDRQAPLLYVSPNQINAVAEVANQELTSVRILRNGIEVAGFTVGHRSADPQIFRYIDGSAVAVNEDGALNSAARPARPGSIVAVWGTGLPLLSKNIPGEIATGADAIRDTIEIGGPYARQTVHYSGAAPGAARAVFQVNFQVPDQYGVPYQGLAYPAGVLNPQSSEPFVIWVAPLEPPDANSP